MLDIHIGTAYPGNVLSNLAHNAFVFDDIRCGGMEGLLQSLKFQDVNKQIQIAAMSGTAAKFRGAKKKWYNGQTLYWKGVPFSRHTDAYQNLLDNAYDEMFVQNESFRKALTDSKNTVLCHSIGHTDPFRTILTVEEFLCRLNRLRSLLLVAVKG
ncbi:gp30.3 conserved hypothetical protein [Aeromonas phage Aeh1]|uniref:Uncharacterized protein n=1 Tax=Aeromonas phage Aeh1 TaxID=2880362 RepID=Q76YH6_9CAUD|nr:hypothetical protein Aeh1p269 [Aeromonas phage Aeh1]AAQ17919.1 gp30.3 conserved hypothetical protein [Aeromonas phage Aeh1]